MAVMDKEEIINREEVRRFVREYTRRDRLIVRLL